MINYTYETEFELSSESKYSEWISKVIESEGKTEGEINYIFCDDAYLLEINRKYLNHDTFTDIISFDYSVRKELHGDIFVSTERVAENALEFAVTFENELKRVMAHGILHFCGFKDKSKEEKSTMREKEDEKIEMFHVEQ